jgi:hypothetical protein
MRPSHVEPRLGGGLAAVVTLPLLDGCDFDRWGMILRDTLR